MQEILTKIAGYLAGTWRFRWYGLGIAWVIAIGGWVWVNQLPERYESRARVHIDTNSLLRPLLRGLAIQPDIRQRVNLVSKTLLSRPNMEKLMRMADLDLAVNTDADKERVLRRLKGGVRFYADRGNSSLYSVAFTHRDRDTAQRIVQSLITIFIENTMGTSRDDGEGAQVFLDEQIADYEGRLADAEERLADFKQRHVGSMPGQAGGYYKRLALAKNKLKDVQLQLREMENRQQEIQRQLDGEEPVFGFGGEDFKIASAIDHRISSLEGKLDNLLMKYTERHPEVVQIRALVGDLEAQRESEIEQVMSEPSLYTNLNTNPVYQQMRSMLSQAEAKVAELNVRAREYKLRVKDMDEAVDNVPLIEAELKKLNRDYSVISKQHSTLLSRRESAHITEEVKQRGSDVKFRVIDPPFSPQKPSEPKVLLLNATVLGGAMGAGVALAFLLSMLKPLVSNQQMLREITGLPVFGSIQLVKSNAEKRQSLKQTVIFCGVTLGLLLVFASLNLRHTMGMA